MAGLRRGGLGFRMRALFFVAIVAGLVLAVLVDTRGSSTRPQVPAMLDAESEDESEGEREREGEQEGEPSGEQTEAMEIALERWMQRSAGRDSIPFGAILDAESQVETMRSRTRDAGLWTWTWLGPGNIGGRVRAILPHPTNHSRIWVAGVSGGIWRTDNAGTSWIPVDDFLPSLSVTSMAMDPTNTSVMYAGTGELFTAGVGSNFGSAPGAGIFKSTDGGTNWFQLASTDNGTFTYVSRLAHHPTTPDLLYAAAWTTALLVSTDGGESWANEINTGGVPVDVKIQASNPNRILVGCRANGSQGEVWLSTDAGVSWFEQTTGAMDKLPDATGRCEVAFGSGNFMYVSMNRNGGECWRSTDAGSTWKFRSSISLGQGEYDNALWVDPTNSNLVVLGGVSLYRSTDGGLNFNRISSARFYRDGLAAHADHHTFVQHPGYNGTTNRTLYCGNDGGIQRATNIATVDTTSGWTNLARGLGITQFYSAAVASDGSRIIGGTQDNTVPMYDQGDGINDWYMPLAPGDGGYSAINPNDPDIVYNEYVNLAIVKSTDGGLNYFNSYTGLGDAATSNALFIAPFRMNPFDANVFYAGGTSLWKSTNATANWSSVRAPVAGAPKCSAMDVRGSEIWVGYTDGTISRSTNSGSSWTNVHTGVPDRWITDIAISPYFSGEAIVTLAGFNSDNVWITGNGGTSWLERTGTAPDTLPALQVNAVSYHPTNPDWIYIGTDLGMFASEDFGSTWNTTPAYSGNDGPANVEVTDIVWYDDRMVISTHGRGMWRCRPLDIVYVDKANNGFEDGSQQFPYNTVSEGLGAVGNGTDLSIKAGTYTEGPKLVRQETLITATNGAVVIN